MGVWCFLDFLSILTIPPNGSAKLTEWLFVSEIIGGRSPPYATAAYHMPVGGPSRPPMVGAGVEARATELSLHYAAFL